MGGGGDVFFFFFTALYTADHVMAVGWRGEEGRVKGGGRERGRY